MRSRGPKIPVAVIFIEMTSSLTRSPALTRCNRDDISCRGQDSIALPWEPSREARIGWANDFPEDFEILSKVGEGTFSTVWSAKAKSARQDCGGGGLEKLVALKRIHPTCSPSRILNEFEQMRKLGGGCVVCTLNLEEAGLLLYDISIAVRTSTNTSYTSWIYLLAAQ